MQGKEELIASRTIDRFSMWKNMLKSGSYAKKKYKGLLGELIVFNSLLDMFEAKETIECWIGPEAKEKDYSFPEFWLEVKTIKPEKLEVKITSLQQLDSATDGYLVVCKVEEIDTGGITCSSLYEAISTKLGFGYELFAFRNKLEDLGFMPYVLNPIQYKFKLISIDTYAVKDFPDKKFPRLTSTMGHPAIKSVNYTLTLAALEDWRVINE